MKVMTCRQMGGSCDKTFKARSFERMEDCFRLHILLMLRRRDEQHLSVLKGRVKKGPNWQEAYRAKKRQAFEAAREA